MRTPSRWTRQLIAEEWFQEWKQERRRAYRGDGGGEERMMLMLLLSMSISAAA
jgi:hypothetical protein